MAQQIARTVTNISQHLPGGYMPSGTRGVASAAGGPIEEMSAKAGVEPEQQFVFQEFADNTFRRRREAPPIKNTAGKVDMSSASFANIMGQEHGVADSAQTPQYGSNAFRGMLSRAIEAYESTADVISGGVSPLGASFSLTL